MSVSDHESYAASSPFPETMLQEDVSDIFRALRNETYAALREPAQRIGQSGMPFSRYLSTTAYQLETTQLSAETESEQQYLQLLRQEVFAMSLRTYAYSGAQLSLPMVRMTADYVGVDRKWLIWQLRPTNQFLIENQINSPSDRRQLRSLGYEAMRQLDLLPRYGSWFMKLADTR